MKTKLLLLASFALAIPAANAATTIFSHTFDEGTGGLDGTAVDVGTGSWEAAPTVNANGAFTDVGSATLAFTPSQGTLYQLDARIIGITGNANWVALGFANGRSTISNTNSRFASQSGVVVEGRAWMMARGDNGSATNRVFTEGTLAGSGFDWNGTIANANGGDLDMRILLDTTGGAGTWTATWFAKRPADGSYTEVESARLLPNESIDSVGFALSDSATTATLQSFSLTQIPEPSAALLGGLGMLALLRRRR